MIKNNYFEYAKKLNTSLSSIVINGITTTSISDSIISLELPAPKATCLITANFDNYSVSSRVIDDNGDVYIHLKLRLGVDFWAESRLNAEDTGFVTDFFASCSTIVKAIEEEYSKIDVYELTQTAEQVIDNILQKEIWDKCKKLRVGQNTSIDTEARFSVGIKRVVVYPIKEYSVTMLDGNKLLVTRVK